MIGSIQSSSFFPQLTIAEPKQIIKNAAKIAPIALAAIALANLSTADGGAVTYSVCVASCEAFAAASTGGIGAAAFLMQCIQACIPLLANPL